MVNTETFYTGLPKATFSVRGYLDISRDFEIYFQDKWGNKSQVKKETLTPIYLSLIHIWKCIHNYPFFLALYSEGGIPIVLVNNLEK